MTDWTGQQTDSVHRKGQSHLHFLRRLGSFNICKKLLQMFYQSVVASVLFYAVVCWGGSKARQGNFIYIAPFIHNVLYKNRSLKRKAKSKKKQCRKCILKKSNSRQI